MARPRVVETDQGIRGELNVTAYDQIQRRMRDKGWIETKAILKCGITHGRVLEVGPGPGYLGQDFLMSTEGTTLTGLDISPDMISLAERNARENDLSDRVDYVLGTGSSLPFEGASFDGVFTNGSLHEWEHPVSTLGEIWRVLRPGGRVFVSDLRRDMTFFVRWFMWAVTKPREIRPGLITSINAAYTPDELRELIDGTELAGCDVTSNLIGVTLVGVK